MESFNPSDFSILMVDDLPKNLQVLGNTLKKQNYNIEFTISGTKALEWLKEKEFDLLLLDVMMPEMDGFEVCKRIRKNHDLDDMPIIFLTAQTDKESIVKGFEIGGQDYITKPFDEGELVSRVKTHLELKQGKEKLKEVNKWLEKKVTERTVELKEANEKLSDLNIELERMNNELLNLDARKVDFLKIISHEIRTPLNGILGFLDILKSKLNSVDILEYIEHVDSSALRLEKFSLQALLITELKTRKRELTRQNLAVKDQVISIMYKKFNNQISNKNLNVQFDLSPEDIIVEADNELFDICLTNVIDNAVEYTTDNGIIIVRGYKNQSSTCIEVVDDGKGFSENALKDLFVLFSPGEPHINENTGLDLALVKLIMEAHEGKIEVFNNNTKGATVRLEF